MVRVPLREAKRVSMDGKGHGAGRFARQRGYGRYRAGFDGARDGVLGQEVVASDWLSTVNLFRARLMLLKKQGRSVLPRGSRFRCCWSSSMVIRAGNGRHR